MNGMEYIDGIKILLVVFYKYVELCGIVDMVVKV